MVEPLAGKASDRNAETWLDDVKRSNNLNRIEMESRVTVNGVTGLRVRYKLSEGSEMEETYLVVGAKTYAISFHHEEAGTRLDDLANYSVYLRMVATFTVNGGR